jgi:RNA polymerase sporulation-specific sigma factor
MQINDYLTELKKIHLLDPQEEQQLWQSYKETADLDSRRQLIEHYQPLVFKVAARWQSDATNFMDIIQEGTVGLMEAVERYDHTRGVAFSLFASHRIHGRMINFINQEGRLNWISMESPVNTPDSNRTVGDLLVDSAPAVALQAEQNFLVEQINLALKRLPPKEQLVLTGMYLGECEPKQLAESLDLSLTTIYRLQKKGVRRIRGLLSKLIYEMKPT